MATLQPILSAGFDGGNGELIDSKVMADGTFEARLNMGKEVSLAPVVPPKHATALSARPFTALSNFYPPTTTTTTTNHHHTHTLPIALY